MGPPEVPYLGPTFFQRVAVTLDAASEQRSLVVHALLDEGLTWEQQLGDGGLVSWTTQLTATPHLVLRRSVALDHGDHAGLLPLGEVLSGTRVVGPGSLVASDLLGLGLVAEHGGHPCPAGRVTAAFRLRSPLGSTTVHLTVEGGRIGAWAFDGHDEPVDLDVRCDLGRFLDWLHHRRQLGSLLLPGTFRGDVEVASYLEGAADWSSPLVVVADYLRRRAQAVDQIDALVDGTTWAPRGRGVARVTQ